jgi:hypothetical protein
VAWLAGFWAQGLALNYSKWVVELISNLEFWLDKGTEYSRAGLD